MKKLLVVLGIVGLFQLASIVYYESKMLKKPIMIASEVYLDNNQINLSYITNLMRPSELQSIEIEGVHYYTGQDDWLIYNSSTQPIQEQSYAKYAYYAIFSPTIWLQNEDSKDYLANATEGTVYFTDGYSEKVTLVHQATAHNDYLEFIRNSAGTNGTEARYRLSESFTLTDVTVVEDRVELTSFQINNKEVALPLTQPIELNRKDTIYLATTDGMARFQWDSFTINLLGLDQNNNETVLTYSNSLNSPPSEQWVKDIVKERGEK